jgi:hypothetical protein
MKSTAERPAVWLSSSFYTRPLVGQLPVQLHGQQPAVAAAAAK